MMEPNKPYCYLKFYSAGYSKLYLKYELDPNTQLKTNAAGTKVVSDPPYLDLGTHTYKLDIEVVAGTSPLTEAEFDLNTATGYDPRLEFIEVTFYEVDPLTGNKTKGKGTTQQADADSSDDN